MAHGASDDHGLVVKMQHGQSLVGDGAARLASIGLAMLLLFAYVAATIRARRAY